MQQPQPFVDRRDAGRQLAEALRRLELSGAVVLALPRGGVPVGFEVAWALDLPLDVMLVRKIGAPGHAEFGIGAVTDGDEPQVFLNEEASSIVAPDSSYIREEVERQLVEIDRRRALYTGSRPSPSVSGRTIVLVDDGIATGGTARAALRALRKLGAGRLILAVPVAPDELLKPMRDEADQVICLQSPSPFRAVGLHYQNFDQTSDDEVIAQLDQALKRPGIRSD